MNEDANPDPESEAGFEYHLLQLSCEDGGDPDSLHEFLVECFLDDGDEEVEREPFVSWDLAELNAMLAQCARPATCGFAEEDDETDDDAFDLIERAEEDDDRRDDDRRGG